MKDMALWNEGDWIAAIASVVLAIFLVAGAWAVTRKSEKSAAIPRACSSCSSPKCGSASPTTACARC